MSVEWQRQTKFRGRDCTAKLFREFWGIKYTYCLQVKSEPPETMR
jgi:hypothetical protein